MTQAHSEYKTIVLQFFEFFKMMEGLSVYKRQTRLSNGEEEPVSSHVFKLSLFLMSAYPHLKGKYDLLKVLKLALIHDLPEFKDGDIPLSEKLHSPTEVKKEKARREALAMTEILKALPEQTRSEIQRLHEEYEKMQSPEAKLVKDFDFIEATIQGNLYDVSYWAKDPKGVLYYKNVLQRKLRCPDEPILQAFVSFFLPELLESKMKGVGVDPVALRQSWGI